jgi:hypothetical protein
MHCMHLFETARSCDSVEIALIHLYVWPITSQMTIYYHGLLKCMQANNQWKSKDTVMLEVRAAMCLLEVHKLFEIYDVLLVPKDFAMDAILCYQHKLN